MRPLLKPLAAAVTAAICSLLAACGGASPASDFADELQQPAPASATRGSSLAELPGTGSAP